MLVVQGQTWQTCALRRAGHEIFQVRHAHVGAELVNKARNLVDVPLSVPEQGQGPAYGGRQVYPVVFKDRSQVGDATYGKHLGRVVVGHKQKLVPPQAARNGESAHGVAVAGAVNAVKYAHGAPLPRCGGAAEPTNGHGPASTRPATGSGIF